MDPTAGPNLTGAVFGLFDGLSWDGLFQLLARSSMGDYLAVLAAYVFLNNRRRDAPAHDNTDWATYKTSISFFIVIAEFGRYLMPSQFVFTSRVPVPAEPAAVAAAAEYVPAFLSVVTAGCNFLLLSFEPLHNSMPTPLPTLILAVSLVFRYARYHVLEKPLLSYYSDASWIICNFQLCLFILQLFWKLFVLAPLPRHGREQPAVWQRFAPGWLSTTLALPYNTLRSMDDFDMFPTPRALGSEPLIRRFTPILDTRHNITPEVRAGADFDFKSLRTQFIIIAVPRLMVIVFTHAIPYLVKDVVAFSAQGEITAQDILKYTGYTALLFGGKTLSNAWFRYCCTRFSSSLRGNIIHAFAEKLSILTQKDSLKFKLTTLFGRDLDTVDKGARAFHNIWSCILDLAAGLYLVTSVTKATCSLGLLVPIVVALGEPIAGFVELVSAHDWETAARARAKVATQYTDQYKDLRYTGYVTAFNYPLVGLRVTEQRAANKVLTRRSVILALQTVAKTASPAVIVGATIYYTNQAKSLTIPDYFAIIAVTPLICHSWMTLVRSLKAFFLAFDGVERAQNFLKVPDLQPSDRRHAARTRKVPSLSLVDASFSSDGRDSFRYRDLHFDAGKVTMIIGRSGCGKTSLLRALMGEVHLLTGKVIAPEDAIAYCGESAFIQNVSIKDNITFQYPFEPVWYNNVMHACNLDVEVQKLPQGDETLAGEGGCNIPELRAMVALARAVYTARPVMILDETMDYLYKKTAATVLTRLFGKSGILRRKCTVIFTSTTSRDASFADSILAFNEMRGIQPVLSNLKNLPPGLAYQRKFFEMIPSHPSNRQTLDLKERVFPYAEHTVDSIRSDIEAERMFAFNLVAHTDAVGYLAGGLGLAFLGIIVASTKSSLVFLQRRLDEYTSEGPEPFFRQWAKISVTPLVILPACVTLYCLTAGMVGSFHWQVRLLRASHWTSLKYFHSKSGQKIRNIMKRDLTLLPIKFTYCHLVALLASMSLTVDLYYITFNSGPFSWLMIPPCLFLVGAFGLSYGMASVDVRLLDFDSKVALYKHLIEMVSGLEHMRAFGWQSPFLRKLYELLETSQRAHYFALLMQDSVSLNVDIFACFAALFVVAFSLSFDVYHTPASLGVSMVLVASLSTVIQEVIGNWVDVSEALVSINNIAKFILEAPQPKRAVSNLDASNSQVVWPVHGAIKFENVNLYYDVDRTAPRILNDINLDIPAGNPIGLIGISASGKTALLQSILGLNNYEGTITVDGTDIRQLEDRFVQRRIVAVTPYPLEFPGSLRENLDPLHHTRHALRLSDDAIIDVLKKLTLWREVLRHGAHLDSPMRHLGLSRGHGEILAVARAVLRQKSTKAKIVMLDGALGCVDPGLDLLVNRVLSEEMPGCTIIKVTHHLATLDDAVQVIKMDKGRIHSVFQPGR